jgi:hypothetical protein
VIVNPGDGNIVVEEPFLDLGDARPDDRVGRGAWAPQTDVRPWGRFPLSRYPMLTLDVSFL